MLSDQYYERVCKQVINSVLFWLSERELLVMLWRCPQREFQLIFQLVCFNDTVLISCMKPKWGSYKRLFSSVRWNVNYWKWRWSSLPDGCLVLMKQSLIFRRPRFITHYKIEFKLCGILCCFCYFNKASEALSLYWSSRVELDSISAALSLGGVRAHFPNFQLVFEPRV